MGGYKKNFDYGYLSCCCVVFYRKFCNYELITHPSPPSCRVVSFIEWLLGGRGGGVDWMCLIIGISVRLFIFGRCPLFAVNAFELKGCCGWDDILVAYVIEDQHDSLR